MDTSEIEFGNFRDNLSAFERACRLLEKQPIYAHEILTRLQERLSTSSDPKDARLLRDVHRRLLHTSKVCFVIGPIGKPGTPTRRQADQLLKYLLAPAARACQLVPIRVDRVAEPNVITQDIYRHLYTSRVVIADLTTNNGNVLYELAIRHLLRKPAVQIIQRGEQIPFDIRGIRTIEYDLDLDRIRDTRRSIQDYIRAALRGRGVMADSLPEIPFLSTLYGIPTLTRPSSRERSRAPIGKRGAISNA